MSRLLERLDLLLLIAFPLAVCTLIDFMRFLLAPWLLGFLLPWPLRPLLLRYDRASAWAMVGLFMLVLAPFVLDVRLREPYDQWVLGAGWFLMAFSAGRWICFDLEAHKQARQRARGRAAISACLSALEELSAARPNDDSHAQGGQ